MKKTTLHIVAAITVAATLVTGCEKSHVSRPSVKQQKAITIHCSPYRNVTGYVALCSELRAVTNCMGMDCSGSAVTTTLTNYVLINPATTSPFTFASNQVITPTEQNDVMLAAKAWANANTPSGYFVSYINYQPDIIVSNNNVTYAGVDIIVTYKKCVNTPPPNN